MSESFEVPDLGPAPAMPGLRVAVLGAGKMGGILLQAFLKNNLVAAEQIFATVQHAERAQALSAQFGVEVTTDNLAAARQADVILLGVKPIQVPALIEEIKDALTPKKTVLSFAASVKTRSIEDGAGCELAVIRAMPNTPAMLAAGITALCAGRFVSAAQMAVAQKIFHTCQGRDRRFCTSSLRRWRRLALMLGCRAMWLLFWRRRRRWGRREWCWRRGTIRRC